MVTRKFCDVRGCKNEAYDTVDTCVGWLDSSETIGQSRKEFKPFERPEVRKVDLCSKHWKKWCRGTYLALNKTLKVEEKK